MNSIKQKWFTYTRGTIPAYRLEIALRGVQVFGTRYNGSRADRALYTVHGQNLTWGWDEQQLFTVGRKIINKCSTKSGQARHFRNIQKLIEHANQASEKVRQMDLRRLSNDELIKLNLWLFQETGPAHGWLDFDIDAVDAVFETFLIDRLRQELHQSLSEAKFAEIYKQLATPIHQTYVAEEELAMDQAIRRGLRAADVHRLYERYWWTPLGWEEARIIREDDYLKKAIHFRKNRPSQAQLNKMASLVQRAAENRKKLLKKYGFSSIVRHWLAVLDRYAYYHDRRKEMQCRSIYAFHLWLRAAGRQLGISAKDLEWFYSHEIFKFLRGQKFNRRELVARKKTMFVLADKSRLMIFSGGRALTKRQQTLGSFVRAVAELKGLGVTSGIVRARARVCNGVAEASRKVKGGDVLICGMTLPEYVPVMKRAAAIVTDEGGITCHAAIVARELHKPCIVGTKIATKVFKDGDQVEVDAGEGVIRKL